MSLAKCSPNCSELHQFSEKCQWSRYRPNKLYMVLHWSVLALWWPSEVISICWGVSEKLKLAPDDIDEALTTVRSRGGNLQNITNLARARAVSVT
jgi:hypothetical protein